MVEGFLVGGCFGLVLSFGDGGDGLTVVLLLKGMHGLVFVLGSLTACMNNGK